MTTNATLTVQLGFVGEGPTAPADRRQQIVYDPATNRLLVLEDPMPDGSWVCSPVVARGRRAAPVVLPRVEMERTMTQLTADPQRSPAEFATMWLGALWSWGRGGITVALAAALLDRARAADEATIVLDAATRRLIYQTGRTTRLGLDGVIRRLVEHDWLYPLAASEAGERWRLTLPGQARAAAA